MRPCSRVDAGDIWSFVGGVASRRKLDYAKIRASLENKNPDDARPWFLTAQGLPPEMAEVRVIWRDGMISSGYVDGGRWIVQTWSSHRVNRDDAPVGWKPLAMYPHNSDLDPPRIRLPNPTDFGLQLID